MKYSEDIPYFATNILYDYIQATESIFLCSYR